MYIACRDLNLGGKEPVRKGEPVDTSAMHHMAVRSLLNMEWIVKVDDESPKPELEAQPQKANNKSKKRR